MCGGEHFGWCGELEWSNDRRCDFRISFCERGIAFGRVGTGKWIPWKLGGVRKLFDATDMLCESALLDNVEMLLNSG